MHSAKFKGPVGLILKEKDVIRENLSKVISLVEAEPEKWVDLGRYVSKLMCGTFHCTLGLIAASGNWPEIWLDDCSVIISDEYLAYESDILNDLFGVSAYERLFHQRGSGDWDVELLAILGEGVSDKELALARLKCQLKFYPEVVA